MYWQTHMLAGGLAGFYATNDWRGAAIGVVCGIIPDLDEPKSKFGRKLPWLSKPLNRVFGHRKFTHSLLFAILIFIIIAFISNTHYALAGFVGILSHIFCDMLTGKLQLCYPQKKRYGIKIAYQQFARIDRNFRRLLWLIALLTLYYYIFMP